MNIQLVFYCVLSLLLSYSTFVSVYISFIKNQSVDFLTFCFIVPLVTFSIVSIYQTYQLARKEFIMSDRMKAKTKDNLFWILSIICFISLLAGFFNVYTQYLRGTFFDELSQLSRSIKTNIIKSAAYQQQPPLDYYFSAFVSELWNQQSKFSLRFHAIFSYLFLSFIVPIGLYRFCGSFIITIIGSCLFLTNHIIRLHSIYARPLSLALLTGFLFLFFYLSYCDNKSNEKDNLFPVISSQYLFVMSVGMQPVILIVSLFLSSFILFFEKQRTIFKKLFICHFITALLVLPIYINMYLKSKVTYKFKISVLETVKSYFINYDFFELFETYFFRFYEKPIVFCVFSAILIVTISLRKKIPHLTKMTGLTLILFPVIYDFLFQTLINWGLVERYFITLSLPLILCFTMSLKDIYNHWIHKRWKPLMISPVIICFLLFYMQIIAIKNETQFRFPYQDNSIDKIYLYLEEKGTPKDIVMDFSLTTILGYQRRDIFYNKQLFYRPNIHPKIIKKKRTSMSNIAYNIAFVDFEKHSNKEKQSLFLVVNNENRNNKAYTVLSSFMKGKSFGKFFVFELPLKGKNKQTQYINFLHHLLERTPKKQSTYLYETLLYYTCQQKNSKEFKRLLKAYKKLEPYLQDIDPYYKFPEYFELKKRVKYFENKNCTKT